MTSGDYRIRFRGMKALIVLAHPERASFNAALAEAAREALCSQGHEVRVTNLYERSFAPDEHARHFRRRKDPGRFDAQSEQRFSAEHDSLPHDVERQVGDLLWADFTLLQFPLWWFGMPAILKGWMDRVFVYGKLYTGSARLHQGVCRGKRAMLSVTAGSSAEACGHDGQEGDTHLHLWPIHYALHYLGFSVLEPQILYGVRGGLAGVAALAQRRDLARQLCRHRELVEKVDEIPQIPFNTAQDWNEQRRLKALAPVHSPFIRHSRDWRDEGDARARATR